MNLILKSKSCPSLTIRDRFRMHTQNCSSTKKHLIDAHSIDRVTTVELVDVEILASAANKRDLIFLEAILLREHKPTIINSLMEGEERIKKKKFKH